jgi:hypothetical protein
MIPTPNIDALTALLATEPVRTQGDKRKPVRKAMDENADLFRQLAERGHTADKVVAGFLVDFPELRESRRDLDDDGYRRHVRDSYISFRRSIGVRKPKTAAPRKADKSKDQAVERKSQASPVVMPATPAPEPVREPEKPAVTTPVDFSPKPTSDRVRIPTRDDL